MTEPVDELPPRRRLERQSELLAFSHQAIAAGRGERMALPTKEQSRAIQVRFLKILEQFVTAGHAEIGLARVQVGRNAGEAWLSTEPLQDDLETEAVFTLAGLLGSEGHRVKRCAAPRDVKRGDAAPCGRWFVGRSNRSHCSPKCASLASTRAARFGREEERYCGYLIRARARKLPEGRWRAYFDYSSPSEDVQGGPVTIGRRQSFRTQEEANALAIRGPKTLIDKGRVATRP